jgi:glycosyltransferase involved in cell wall biosynthesis
MKLGVINQETWHYLQDIYDYLATQHETQIFEVPAKWPLPVMQEKISHYLYRRQLKRFLEQCDVVFSEWASEPVVEASSMETSAALVTRLHRYEMFKWTDHINWDRVSYAIIETEAMRAKLLGRTNLAPERAVIIPPVGIKEDKLRLATQERPFQGNIGILCRLIPRKRVYELILAFHALRQKMPELHLHIGGYKYEPNIDYYEALLDLVRLLQLEEHITFHGRVEDRWQWYQSIDIFVSFSFSEGMQVAPLEAIACGCYCLTHRWAGADELYGAEQLFLTEEEFVQKTLTYAQATENQRKLMREPSLAFVSEQCNFHKVSRDMQEVIEKAYEERN